MPCDKWTTAVCTGEEIRQELLLRIAQTLDKENKIPMEAIGLIRGVARLDGSSHYFVCVTLDEVHGYSDGVASVARGQISKGCTLVVFDGTMEKLADLIAAGITDPQRKSELGKKLFSNNPTVTRA